MEFQEAFKHLNALCLEKTGKHLTDSEKFVLQGTWSKQKYSAIAKDCHYSANTLQHDVAPKLWEKLSKILGEKVRKHNLRSVLNWRWPSITDKPNQKQVCGTERLGIMKLGELDLSLQKIFYTIREGNEFSRSWGQKTISFSRNWEYIATVSYDRHNFKSTVEVLDSSGNQITTFNPTHVPGEKVIMIAFSPNRKFIATVSSHLVVKLWDLQGNQINEFSFESQYVTWRGIEFSPDGDCLAIHQYSPSSTTLWKFSGNEIAEIMGSYVTFRFSTDGKYVASVSTDDIPRLWDLHGNQITEFKGHESDVNCISFSPKGHYIATASADHTAKLWDFSGNLLAELKGHEGEVDTVVFSPDGRYIATGSDDDTARVWDLSGNQIAILENDDWVSQIAFSPDGQYIATDSSYTARLWNLSGELIAEFKGHQDLVISVKFSPDGEYLITESELGSTRLWDLSGNQIAEFTNKY